jgi:hypothetical protein
LPPSRGRTSRFTFAGTEPFLFPCFSMSSSSAAVSICSSVAPGCTCPCPAFAFFSKATMTPISSSSTVELARPPVTTVLTGTTSAARISATTCYLGEPLHQPGGDQPVVGHATGEPNFPVQEVEKGRVAELPVHGQPVELCEGEEDVYNAFP